MPKKGWKPFFGSALGQLLNRQQLGSVTTKDDQNWYGFSSGVFLSVLGNWTLIEFVFAKTSICFMSSWVSASLNDNVPSPHFIWHWPIKILFLFMFLAKFDMIAVFRFLCPMARLLSCSANSNWTSPTSLWYCSIYFSHTPQWFLWTYFIEKWNTIAIGGNARGN